jgi:multidrug efflux system membrane fusion protein
VVAYSSDGKAKIADGALLTPNNSIDTTTGTIQLKATFANDNDALWPGEFVNARLRVDTLQHAVTIPMAAIQHGPNGLYVFTIKSDSTAQQQTVQVTYQDGDNAVISQGLNGGDNVVLTGQSRLSPGTRVTIDKGNSTAVSNN